MRKKRRVILFALNLLAAGLATGSAWLQWWNGAWPAMTDTSQLLTSAHIDAPSTLVFSVAMVIFVVAGLMLFTALTSWKLFSFLGAIIGAATVVMWFINSGLSFNVNLLNSNQIGVGVWAMIAAVFLSLLSIFIRKKKEKAD